MTKSLHIHKVYPKVQ